MNHLNNGATYDSYHHSHSDRSLLRVVVAREHGLCLQTSFAQSVARRIWGTRDDGTNNGGRRRGRGSGKKELLMTSGLTSSSSSTHKDGHHHSNQNHLEIVSPHTRSINCLDIDRRENRFLLVGSSDATVSLYDISPWGNNERRSTTTIHGESTGNANADTTYHPIAQSIRQPPRSSSIRGGGVGGGEGDGDPFASVPSGHTSRISYAQWYPTDAGIFLTASATSSSSGGGGGEVLLWDTAQMKPVLNVQPFRSDLSLLEDVQTSGPITAYVRGGNSRNATNDGSSSSLSPSLSSSTPMLATAAWNLSPIKLVDLNSPSGPAAFTLTGHVGGVTAIQWSPTNSNVLVSGGHDSTIRLWDIRKSGSRAMITTLNRERVVTSSTSTAAFFSSSFSYLDNEEGAYSIFVRSGPNFKSDYSHLREVDEEQQRSSSSLKRRRQQQHGKLVKKQRQRPLETTIPAKSQRRLVCGYLNSPQGSSLPPSSMYDNPSNYDAVESASTKIAHSGHVAGLTFTNDGRYLASVGALDGELLVWDLVKGARRPTKFIMPGGLGQATEPHQRGRVPICIEDLKYDKNWDSTIWIPRGSKILGFNLMDGGCPTQTLCGSLSNIESLGMNRFDKTLFSGSQDGMVLAWGSLSPYNLNPSRSVQSRRHNRRRGAREDDEDEDSW